jgi:hypothetical protein
MSLFSVRTDGRLGTPPPLYLSEFSLLKGGVSDHLYVRTGSGGCEARGNPV